MPPAPLPVLAGVYYARVEAFADLKSITNILSFKKSGVPLGDPSDHLFALAVSTAIANRWPAVATAAMHTVYAGSAVSTYALGSPLVPPQVAPLTSPGGRVGDEHFKQLAVRIKHTVTRRGRGSQHSTYLSPISILDVTVNGDQFNAGQLSALQTAWDGFIAFVISDLNTSSPGSWTYVQVSKFQNKVLTPNTFPVTASVAEGPLSSQRRRLGRG